MTSVQIVTLLSCTSCCKPKTWSLTQLSLEQATQLTCFDLLARLAAMRSTRRPRMSFSKIFLLETMIDFRARPDAQKRLVDSEAAWDEWIPGSGDMNDQFNFPPCRPHASANDIFIELKDASRYSKKRPSSGSQPLSSTSHSTGSSGSSGSSGLSGSSSLGSRHILREIQLMLSNEHPNMDVFVSQTNSGIWKVVMQGPPDSPYKNGVFLLLVDIGPDFPRMPPGLRFITPMLHPNISKVRANLPSFLPPLPSCLLVSVMCAS